MTKVIRFSTIFALVLLLLSPGSTALAEPDNPMLRNSSCLMCHGRANFSMPTDDGEARDLHVEADSFTASVHGSRDCVSCHEDISQVPHQKGVERQVGCVQCHQELWAQAQENGASDENARLGEVVGHIESYMGSIHARPSMKDQSRTNATCYDCHDAHYIAPIDSHVGANGRLGIPATCGQCHGDVLDEYLTSVHGSETSAGNANAAVCSDCHTSHNIEKAHDVSSRLAITANCGNCHEENLHTYLGTYHGKVTRLGYGETAKCYDCHGFHGIKRLEDEASKMHINNRLEACQTCHADATEGYVSFEPHGTTHDIDRFPQMWVASTFMIGLLISTFAFFWLHSALWFFREWQDRKEGKNRPYVMEDAVPGGKTHIRRFGRWWRLAHLVGALSIMTLALTGLTVLYAESTWAPIVMNLLGGPQASAYLHRIGAIGFIAVFFIHLVYFAFRIGRNWRTFQWFGPNSLIPNWQDLKDAMAMFQWFFGKGPRPVFDRFTYWEKFDYWAPFWGMMIIGVSGVMMWFPAATASVMPGWVFNVAAIVHGEEAFLAIVFLFTVHFFNNHFRPDKFPQDITMFTGRVPLEIFKHEHKREYERMVNSGEIDDYLVEAPSKPLTRGSKILGATLITIGLTLLTMVLLGFLGI